MHPLEIAGRTVLVWGTADILDAPPAGANLLDDNDPTKGFIFEGVTYVHPPIGRKYLPDYIIKRVDAKIDLLPAEMQSPLSASNFCNEPSLQASNRSVAPPRCLPPT